MDLNDRLSPIRNSLFYALYMATACGVTSGLNILHTKYVLDIEFVPIQFMVPIIAGVIFGGMLARARIESPVILNPNDYAIFVKFIIFSCFVTAALNIAHTELVLNTTLTREMFIAPLIAGLFFGYLLARVKILNTRLTALATTDSLTGAHNRLHFDELLEKEATRVKRYSGTFSIIFFDVDNFKMINDKHGHHIGDKVLIRLVTLINTCIRNADTIARYGGEEFIILSPETDLDGARMFAEQLRIKIENNEFDCAGSLTCSFGVAAFDRESDTSETIIKLADNALYAAKAGGKNRVIINNKGRMMDLANFEPTQKTKIKEPELAMGTLTTF